MHNDLLAPSWPAPPSIKAYTTLRTSSIVESTTTPISTRYQRLQKLITLPSEPVWLNQTHSNLVVAALEKNKGIEADASFSQAANQICTVLTADCLPVLLCNLKGSEVAAIHAGWRGLAAGIIENTLHKLTSASSELIAWLGPAIGPNCFEVKKDVYDAFTATDPEARSAFTLIADQHWLADLYQLARLRLQKFGITQIYGGNFCTYTEQDRFYSYRREGKSAGRMVSLIWISD